MIKYIVALLPSGLKILMFRALGAKIGKNCYIGLSLIDAESLELGDCVHIGHFNILRRLNMLRLESGSRLNNFNWITCAGTGMFLLGRNSAITRFHFFEASANIVI